MRFLRAKSCVLAAAMVVCAGKAAWAVPMGTLTCTGSATSITAQVSSYQIGISNTFSIGSAGSGAGAGKVVFNPADVHVALSKFDEFFTVTATGTPFTQCVLTATAGNGVTAAYTFSLVAVTKVTAVANIGGGAEGPDSYTDVQLEYGALQVSFANHNDDGGTKNSK